MHLIDGAGHVNNQFVSEDAATSRPPTEITADIMNAIQNEIANAVEAMGLALSKASDTQLRDGLNGTFARRDGTIHYVDEIYTIVADQAALAQVATGGLPDGARALVTNYYGMHQAAMATWTNGAWSAAAAALNVFDLYATTFDNHGYYWFAGAWNLFDVAVSQVGEATEEEPGLVRLATWADVLAGGLAALALRPRHMVDYIDQMFIGAVADFAATTVPAVWLPASGQLVLRAARPKLWAFAQAGGNLVAEAAWASNTGKFSSGDGSTNFRLPDLRGQFRRGWDNGRGVDAGRAIGSVQGDAIRNITGAVGGLGNSGGPTPSGAFYKGATINAGYGAFGEGAGGCFYGNFDASRVVPTASENRPRNVAVLACIYAGAPAQV